MDDQTNPSNADITSAGAPRRALQRYRLSPPRSNASMYPDPNGDWVRFEDLPPMIPHNAVEAFEKGTRGLLSRRQHAQLMMVFHRALGLPVAAPQAGR